jgi:hypothetical protein
MAWFVEDKSPAQYVKILAGFVHAQSEGLSGIEKRF